MAHIMGVGATCSAVCMWGSHLQELHHTIKASFSFFFSKSLQNFFFSFSFVFAGLFVGFVFRISFQLVL